MRSLCCSGDDTGRQRLAAVEQFDVNASWRDAEGCKSRLHVGHEVSRTAEVNVGVVLNGGLLENRLRQMTFSVEVARLIVLAGLAETDVATSIWQSGEQSTNFCGKWMMLAVASRV